MSIHVCGRNFKIDPKKHGKLSMAAWNVRTLLDSAGRPERRTAIIARELDRYGIDVAALSETRFEATTQFEEVGAGNTSIVSVIQKAKRGMAGLASLSGLP